MAIALLTASATFANSAYAESCALPNVDHRIFLQQEEARREIQDRERALRAERRRIKFENERRDVVRKYSANSPEYRWFLTRWDQRWDAAVTRERELMIDQREAAQKRFAENHVAGIYTFLTLNSLEIDRALMRSGVVAFPYSANGTVLAHNYGNDNVSRPYVTNLRDYQLKNQFVVRAHN